MSLDTYTNLQAEITDWLNRADLAAKVPTFIRLLEAQVQRTMRVREMVTVLDTTLAGGTNEIALPADYLQMKRIRVTSSVLPSDPLEYASEGELDRIEADLASNTGAQPTTYGIVGSNIRFTPPADQDYSIELTYYAKITGLSSGNQTNWLLNDHPDIYLYGALMQAAPYLKDDDRVPVWQSVLSQLLEDLRIANERAENAGKPLRARIRPYGVVRPPQ